MTHKVFYVTTAIPYVNAKLHLGNLYEAILADFHVRYHRIRGEDVFFLTGTDEHGQKIYKSAMQSSMTPQEFVDKMSAEVRRLWDLFQISYDDFIRTTESRHEKVVQEWFTRAREKGDIYLGTYEGWYCVPCETLLLESQLVEGNCPDCGRPVEKVRESNYFFRLSKFQKSLLAYIEEHPDFVIPEIRRNEVTSLIKQGLNDISISRTAIDWGVEIPFDREHVSYVWVDALINYISAPGAFFDQDRFVTIWPANYHHIGKDILKFHAVIWPAMLMSVGLELPEHIAVHGWLLSEEEKMSKSKGNILDPDELSERYGVDALRYFLLREISFGLDGSFSHEMMKKRYNSDLSNDIGNLLSRTVAMIERYCDGLIPPPTLFENIDEELKMRWSDTRRSVDEKIELLNFREALDDVWSFINAVNKYLDTTAPWSLAKFSDKKERMDTILYNVAESLRLVAQLIFPVMPASAQKIWDQLGVKREIGRSTLPKEGRWSLLESGLSVGKRSPLFPRIEEEAE